MCSEFDDGDSPHKWWNVALPYISCISKLKVSVSAVLALYLLVIDTLYYFIPRDYAVIYSAVTTPVFLLPRHFKIPAGFVHFWWLHRADILIKKKWELFSFHFLRACHLAGMTGFAAAARTGSFLFGCTRCGGSLATTAKKLKPEKKPNSVVGA